MKTRRSFKPSPGQKAALKLLSDSQWHSFIEGKRRVKRFTQHVYDLKKKGYQIEAQRCCFDRHGRDYRWNKG